MNTVWLLVVCISIVFAAINGRIDGFTKAMFEAGEATVEVCLYLVGIVSLWLGLTKILEDSGLIYKLSNFFRPAISFLFRKIPEGHPAITSITLNLLANLFGLGNAATPLGIKAMEDLQTLTTEKDTITFEMMLFMSSIPRAFSWFLLRLLGFWQVTARVTRMPLSCQPSFLPSYLQPRGGDIVFIQKIQPER